MAKPIEATVLSEEDFNRLVKDLENPKPNPKAQKLYDEGKKLAQKLNRTL